MNLISKASSNLPMVLGLAAYSNTGKTTLISRLLPILNSQGIRIAVIKHSHHAIELDTPGKDSYQLREAGANPFLLVTPGQQLLFNRTEAEQELSLQEHIELFKTYPVDLILVEGFRDAPIPKIELHRPSLGKPLLYPEDPNIVAFASDERMELPGSLIDLDLNNPAQIATYITERLGAFHE